MQKSAVREQPTKKEKKNSNRNKEYEGNTKQTAD